jgi:starch phosphorylase
VHGRVDADDRLVNPEVLTLIAGDADGDKWRYEVGLKLARTGPFGYTVRVVPWHVGLRSAAELGLQALPQAAGAGAVDS